jgi:hypothetical protein
MDEYGRALVEEIEEVLPGWVERSVAHLVLAWRGSMDPEVAEAAAEAGARAREDVGGRVRQLVEADIDEQATTPLAILRDAVRYPTEVLQAAGVPPVERDEFAEGAFPDDRYGLTPASWAEVDARLAEPAMAWGAAKAMAHKERHGGSGTGRG